MEAEVHQPLGDVQRGDAVLALEAARAEDELVHAQPVVGEIVGVSEAGEQVVGVQHGGLGHATQGRPVGADEGVGAHEDAEGPGEAPHPPHGARPVALEVERPIVPAHEDGHRQVRLERRPDRDRAAAWPAPAVRLAKRLVEVDVNDVEAHVARP